MSDQFSIATRQRGLTLVELLIAMAIGLFLVGSVAALYVNTRRGFDYSNEVARIQETGRFAIDTISRDVRMAGYNGCGRVVPTTNVITGNTTNDMLNFSTPFRGYDNGAFSGSKAGSDALIVMGVSPNSDLVVQSHNPPSAQINSSTHSIQPGEVLLVTDCSRASIFQVSGPTNNNNNATNVVHNTGNSISPGNSTKYLGPSGTSYTYKPGSMMYRLTSTAYYVATASGTAGQNGLNSLWARRIEGSNGTAVDQELLTGVDDFQIAYGIDKSIDPANPSTTGDGTIDEYQPASYFTATNMWNQVVAVRINLLVRSLQNNVTAGDQDYVYVSQAASNLSETSVNVTTTDRVLRKVFSETITLRNRTL